MIVGGLEALNLIGDQLGLTDDGGFWGMIGTLNDNFGILGYLIVAIFVAAWLLSYVILTATDCSPFRGFASRRARSLAAPDARNYSFMRVKPLRWQ